MQELIKLQKTIIPEMVDALEKRYNILRTIFFNQPVGRRMLANQLGLGERIVRTEINFLKTQNLIEITTPGMYVTSEGLEILESLKELIHDIKGLSSVEKQIKNLLKLKDVVVVPGSIDDDYNTVKEMGKAAANYVKAVIKSGDIVAITGGSTVREVVDNFPKVQNLQEVLVVPARGGMGKNVETQSNTLAANLAKKVNGSYKMLHIPDNVSEEIMATLSKEKGIKEIIEYIHSANILIYGIGEAQKMALKRGVPTEFINKLVSLGAIGEAFGFYFNKESEIVSVMPTLGINIEHVKKIETHIAVAGGKNKAEAIIATIYNNNNAVLITDEGAAQTILKNL